MKKLDVFLIALVPVQFWGMAVYFSFAGNPDSWAELFDILIVLAYSTFFNLFEAFLFAVGIWLTSQLFPKSAGKEKLALVQLTICGLVAGAAILAQLLPYGMDHYISWPPLVYLAINLVNTKVYRMAAISLVILFSISLLYALFLRILRSPSRYAWITKVVSALATLAWLYVGIDFLLAFVVLLRVIHVI